MSDAYIADCVVQIGEVWVWFDFIDTMKIIKFIDLISYSNLNFSYKIS